MVYGKTPFPDDRAKFVGKITWPQQPAMSTSFQTLIRNMLHPEPPNRATIDHVLNCEWLNSIGKETEHKAFLQHREFTIQNISRTMQQLEADEGGDQSDSEISILDLGNDSEGGERGGGGIVQAAINKYSVEKSKTQHEIKRGFTNDFVSSNRIGREPTRAESMRVPVPRNRSLNNTKTQLTASKSLSIDKRNTEKC